MNNRYINPFTDFGFKKIFGSEYSKDILIDFLNQVLGGKEKILDLSYNNSEKLGKSEEDRKSIFDIYCTNAKGERFIIELQNASQLWLKDRIVYYATYPIQEQAEKGKNWNYQLNTVYTIVIMNFTLNDGDLRCRKEVKLLDTESHKTFYDKLTFVFLEIPNFTKDIGELDTDFDRWIYVLKRMQYLQELPESLRNRIFEKVFKIAEIANLNKEEMTSYEKSQQVLWDNYAVLEAAHTEGLEKGVALGVEKSKALQEKRERDMVINMNKEGIDVNTISRVTNLSVEKIKDILKDK